MSSGSSNDSVHWQFRHDNEWSVNEETEDLVESLSSRLDLVSIDDSPLLVSSILFPSIEVTYGHFFISSGDCEYLFVSTLVDDVITITLVMMPP